MTSYLRNRIFLSFILLGFIYHAESQSVRKIAIRHKLSTQYGLSSYNVNKVLQDPYGYIWLSTQDGLNRYDGRRYTIYSRSSDESHRLLGNVINDMVVDSVRKVLWVTTSYGGLNAIDLLTGEVVHAMKSSTYPERFKSEWLKCLNLSHGNVWIGTSDGLQAYDPDRKRFLQIDSLPATHDGGRNHNIAFIYPDQYNHVWVYVTDFGLLVYDASGKLLNQYSADSLGVTASLGFLQFSSRIIQWSAHELMWATDHGFRILTYDETGKVISCNASIPVNKYFGDKAIFSCAKDPQGNLWFSTFDRLYSWTPGSHNYETIEDIVYTPGNDYLNTVMHVFFDNQDNLWLGTQYGAGVCDYHPPAILPFYKDRNSPIQINHAYYILPANDSVVYVAAQHGAFKVNIASGKMTSVSGALRFNYIFRTPDQRVVFSNQDGLYVLGADGELLPASRHYPEFGKIEHEMINAVINSGDSVLLLSSEKTGQVFRWNVPGHSLSVYPIPLPAYERGGIINTLYLDSKNTAWFLFDNAIVTQNLTSRKCSTLPLKDPDLGIPMNIFMDVCELQHDYWLAVYGKGIVRLDSSRRIKKIYGERSGLRNTGVYTVLPFKDSLLFITTNYGLFTLDPRKDQIRQYLVSDGLNTSNFEENCGISFGDKIFVGGEQGVSVIQPANFRQDSAKPRLYVDRVMAEKVSGAQDTFNLFLQRFHVDNDWKQATVYFSALDYAHPEKVNYSYRIPQVSDGWVDLADRNFINLIGLAPGSYTVEVKAFIENGEQTDIRQLALYVEPKWYQTIFFKIFLVVAIVALVAAFYRYRIGQIRKQMQIRRDIATDLHDDIGSTLNSAKIFAHLARKDENRDSNLKMVEQTLTDASGGLRDIIWLLDDSRDTYGDFVERINRFAGPIASAQHIELKAIMDPDLADRPLSKQEKKTFFLIAKEAINNSIKHSGCSKITYEIKPDGDKHTLIVSDNGKGFTPGPSTGNGLGNMRYRAEKIGYMATIDSSPGNGVTVILSKA
jgi:signal transduction histidine kinase/ligand-binding sensor domain-containing protein